MAKTMKDLVAEARAKVAAVSPDEAHGSGGLVLDVREPAELSQKGRVPNALHIPRGLLEAHACADSPMADATLTGAKGGTVVDVLCASGARAALAAATLDGMGYDARVIEGGLDGWRKAGLPVEE